MRRIYLDWGVVSYLKNDEERLRPELYFGVLPKCAVFYFLMVKQKIIW